MPISSRLVINQAALKLKQPFMRELLDAFTNAVNQKNPVQQDTSSKKGES